MEPGEAPEHAVLRKVFEESGLTGPAITSYVGCFAYDKALGISERLSSPYDY
ncbi:MAG: hypothetical protein JWN15_4174 [Firmicutes bacterium]|nr:hypothetical protein [Bacillota bacterium]